MKAIIPAAGYATRLYPLTLDKPKHLLDINGKPMIEHIIKKILELRDIDEIFIVTNQKFFSIFKKWLDGFECETKIKLLDDNTTSNEDRLGQVGDIFFVIKKEKIKDSLLIIAGDNLFNFSLKDSYDEFRNKNKVINALYDAKSVEVAKQQGIAIIDKNNKFIGFYEKPKNPKSTLISLGIYFFPKKEMRFLKEYAESGNDMDKMGYFMTWLLDKTEVYGHTYYEKWFDIGWPESLEQARREFRS